MEEKEDMEGHNLSDKEQEAKGTSSAQHIKLCEEYKIPVMVRLGDANPIEIKKAVERCRITLFITPYPKDAIPNMTGFDDESYRRMQGIPKFVYGFCEVFSSVGGRTFVTSSNTLGQTAGIEVESYEEGLRRMKEVARVKVQVQGSVVGYEGVIGFDY